MANSGIPISAVTYGNPRSSKRRNEQFNGAFALLAMVTLAACMV
jgi:hypothetical protein